MAVEPGTTRGRRRCGGRDDHQAPPAIREVFLQKNGMGNNAPAFFSWTVSSVQLPFMRSRRAIQRSACSWRGMPSHRFSILASVGLEMAWADAAREATAGTQRTRAPLRRTLDAWVRSIFAVSREGEMAGRVGERRGIGSIALALDGGR